MLAGEPSAVIAFPLQDAPEALHGAIVNAMCNTGHRAFSCRHRVSSQTKASDHPGMLYQHHTYAPSLQRANAANTHTVSDYWLLPSQRLINAVLQWSHKIPFEAFSPLDCRKESVPEIIVQAENFFSRR